MSERWGLALPPDFKQIRTELRRLDDKTFAKELDADLKDVMVRLVVPAAKALARSQNVPHEVPGSIRAGADRFGPFVRAGGAKAPAAGVFEGTRAGANRRHPVFAPEVGRVVRTRGGGARIRFARPRSEWTWVTQQRRPFLRPAAAQSMDEVREAAGQAVLRVLERAGLRR